MLHFIKQITLVDYKSPKSCMSQFKSNKTIGYLIAFGLLASIYIKWYFRFKNKMQIKIILLIKPGKQLNCNKSYYYILFSITIKLHHLKKKNHKNSHF